ncbi:S8 family serine peptidase [Ilumatobacter sp.]|uniref:S8 family serine peptidase n=1 Tax=Ilumatobacter sp. TaxID=1967498 RepID=UPI003B5186CC
MRCVARVPSIVGRLIGLAVLLGAGVGFGVVGTTDGHGRADAAVSEDLTPSQGYLDPAVSGGIDARFAWTQPGGRGENVTIVDIEYATWNVDHDDLPDVEIVSHEPGGTPFDFSDDHGTQVLGVMGAVEDGRGMTGIVPAAEFAVIAHLTSNVGYLDGIEAAIRRAVEVLEPGDVILVEANFGGGPAGEDTPVEWDEAIGRAIDAATDSGIVVVQTAGNGSTALDLLPDPFASYGDNGSIVVGAGHPPGSDEPARTALPDSNHGERVDLQGWGRGVATVGGRGDLAGLGSTPCNSPIPASRRRPSSAVCARDTYTALFGGTSSAAPMVAGAAASLSSIAQADGNVLCPEEIREILVDTGTAPPGAGRSIGPQPDLRGAIVEYRSRYATARPDPGEIARIDGPATVTASAERLDVEVPCGGP